MILAIVLVLLMLFCAIAEFSRLWIIAQGVKEAAQQAVISTINDNYDDVYHAVREGYAAGWYPDGTGRWDESVDTGDVYGQLSETLGLENTAGGYRKSRAAKWNIPSPACPWSWKITALVPARARAIPRWWRSIWRCPSGFWGIFCPPPA